MATFNEEPDPFLIIRLALWHFISSSPDKETFLTIVVQVKVRSDAIWAYSTGR
jgi:hypothetical protein